MVSDHLLLSKITRIGGESFAAAVGAARVRDTSESKCHRYGSLRFHCDYIRVSKSAPTAEHTRSLEEGSKSGIVHSTQVISVGPNGVQETHAG